MYYRGGGDWHEAEERDFLGLDRREKNFRRKGTDEAKRR